MSLAFGLMLIFTVISLVKGSGTSSPIGAKKCDNISWILFIAMIVICLIFEIIAIF